MIIAVGLLLGFNVLQAASSPLTTLSQHVLSSANDTQDVPGNSPFVYCGSPDDDLLKVDHVDFHPKQPKGGQNLTVSLSGDLIQDIKNGSQVTYTVTLKVGKVNVPVLADSVDLCDMLDDELDEECPVEKGEMTIEKEFEMPEEAKGKTVIVKFDAVNQDEDRITCMEAEMSL